MTWIWYNDIHLIPVYIFGIIAYILLLFASMLFHEFGHILYFRRIGKRMKLRFVFGNIWDFGFRTGEQEDYDNVTDEQYFYSLWFGILSGLIPIIISTFIFPPSLLMIIPYGVGCFSDLKEINKVYQNRGQNFLNIEDDEDEGD